MTNGCSIANWIELVFQIRNEMQLGDSPWRTPMFRAFIEQKKRWNTGVQSRRFTVSECTTLQPSVGSLYLWVSLSLFETSPSLNLRLLRSRHLALSSDEKRSAIINFASARFLKICENRVEIHLSLRVYSACDVSSREYQIRRAAQVTSAELAFAHTVNVTSQKPNLTSPSST